MLRPAPQAKMGRSWLISARGIRWRVKRLERRRPLVVVECHLTASLAACTAARREMLEEIAMIKPSGPVSNGTGKLAVDDPAAFGGMANLRGFFLDQTYGEDAQERQPGLLILKPSSAGWQFTLKDTATCLMLRFTSRTLDEGWMLANAFLGDPKAPWETDPYEAGKRGRSRKPKA